jgi:Skp family chaperone for outer membrane proteins
MSSQVVVHGRLRPDGTLELDERVNLPPGEVQVTIQPVAEEMGKENFAAFLQQVRAEQETYGFVPRTREQIDAELQAMRDEAEEEMRALETIQERARRSHGEGSK